MDYKELLSELMYLNFTHTLKEMAFKVNWFTEGVCILNGVSKSSVIHFVYFVTPHVRLSAIPSMNMPLIHHECF